MDLRSPRGFGFDWLESGFCTPLEITQTQFIVSGDDHYPMTGGVEEIEKKKISAALLRDLFAEGKKIWALF